MKRVLLILLTPALILMALGLSLHYFVVPRAETWAFNELLNYVQKELPLQLKADQLKIHLLKPSVSLENIELQVLGPAGEGLSSFSVRSVRAHLDLFQLLFGKLQLSAIVIDSVRTSIDLDPLLAKDSKPEPLPLDKIFAVLADLPIKRVFAQNISLSLHSQKQALAFEVQNGSLLLANLPRSLSAKIDASALSVKLRNGGELSGTLDAHLILNQHILKISHVRARLDQSEVVAKGELWDFKNVALNPQGAVNLTTKISLEDLEKELRNFLPQNKLPTLAGDVQAQADIAIKSASKVDAKAQIQTRNVSIEKIQIGDASLQGDLQDKNLSLSEFKISHPSGSASLDGTQIIFNDELRFKTRLHVHDMGLQKLFQSLDLKNIPVDVGLNGDLPCQGQLAQGFNVECEGSLQGKELWVRSTLKDPKSEIVSFSQLAAHGKVQVDAKGVRYQTKLSLGDSQGSTQGDISYDHGFKISYQTDQFDFKNLKNLAHLKFVGRAGMQGSTQGDSNAATFDIQIAAQDFMFEGFYLGQLNTHLEYAKGHLYLNGIQGSQNKTTYNGQLTVDLNRMQIQGQLQLPTADLMDIAKILENLQKLPFPVSGTGQGALTLDGPLDFWKMNYQLDAQFKNVLVGPESFDQLDFQAEATKGNISFKNAVLQKNNSRVFARGGISNQKILNLATEFKGMRLEESDTISRVNSSIFGVFNGVANITGPVSNAAIDARGTITETVIEEQEIPKSDFNVKIDKSNVAADLNLFGGKIKGLVQIPFIENTSPLKLKFTTTDWSFSSLLAILGGGNLVNEYDSNLTGDIDLASASGDIWKSTGTIQIKDLYLKRGIYNFRNVSPILITMNNGMTSIKDFLLEGPDNRIRIRGENFTSEKLNLNIVAEAELRLLHMFMPFLEDLGGTMKTTASVSGSLFSPQILGNMNLSGAYFKIKGFPHPLEKIQADIAFSHTKILINSVKGQIAGGNLSGDGSLLIRGPRDIPMNIRATADSVTFLVPQNVRTSGRAEINITGNWFPFVLSGTYHVQRGFINKEFGGDSQNGSHIRKSVYLPKVLRQANFEPLLLDLQVIMDKNVVIKNSMTDGSITGRLQIKGPPENPIILGKVVFDKNSKLIFKDKVFEVQAGQVQFNNPNEIDPDIYLSAQSRINEYDVSLLVQGTSKTMNLHVSSVPPLSDQDIVSLLALGITSTKLDQNVQAKDQQTQTSLEIGAAIIGAPLNRQLENNFGVNFQFSSSFDSIRNINVPKVTLSKNLSKRVNVSTSKAVSDQQYDIKLQYLLNQNVSLIGSYEQRDNRETTLRNQEQDVQSFFGLDLEFKREFK